MHFPMNDKYVYFLRLFLVRPFQSFALCATLATIVYSIGCDPGAEPQCSRGLRLEAVRRDHPVYGKKLHRPKGYQGFPRLHWRGGRGTSRTAHSSILFPLKIFEEKQNQASGRSACRQGPRREKKGSGFIVLAPDYAAWQKKQEAVSKREQERRKKMTPQERTDEFEKQRKEAMAEQEAMEKAWADTGFERSEFESVIAWIEKNKGQYSTLPPSFKGENPYADKPFGLQHVFFAAANGFLQAPPPQSHLRGILAEIAQESEDSSFRELAPCCAAAAART